jgi:formylglycine-generating enzyme required for sulfatase activity
MEYTLYGLVERRDDQPVCHLSGYEADAYANWANARLPTEAEWEFAARQQPFHCEPSSSLHPRPAAEESSPKPLLQLYDSCWQWTASAYRPYPGFTVQAGAIGEYNGKFMSNQWVLRGGSCVSSPGHLRPSYRNFFYLHDRWQFSGIRLARNP